MISRRDFFKLLGIGALGALAPTKVFEELERNFEMNVGDLLVKLADGIPLSQEEKQQLRLYGNQSQLNNSFITGLQNGQSSINASNVETRSINREPYARGVRVWRSTAQTIANNTATAIEFDTVINDEDGFSDLSNHPTRLTVPNGMGGKYILGFYLLYSGLSVAGGWYPYVATGVKLNGTGFANLVADSEYSASGFGPITSSSCQVNLDAGDYIELIAFQYTGNSNDVTVLQERSPVFWLTKIY